MSLWDRLGIARTRDARAIRRAYAARLKVTHPEDDPAGFQALREAYDAALRFVDRGIEVDADGRLIFLQTGEEAEDDGIDRDSDELNADAAAADDTLRPVPPPESARTPGTLEPTAAREPQPASEPTATLEPQSAAPLVGDRAAFEAARVRLFDLLDAVPAASDQALQLAIETITTSPMMQNLSVGADTESWLARSIADGAPRTDPLIKPAIRVMGWRRGGTGDLAWIIDQIFERRDALAFRKDLGLPGHPQHAAFKALSRPPGDQWRLMLSPLQPRRVRALIDRIDREHPSLESDLDGTLPRWRRYFAQPRISPLALWACLLLGPAAGLALSLIVSLDGALTLVAAVGGVLVALCVAFAWLYAVEWPRDRWRREHRWGAPAWLVYGWAPGGAALLILAGLLPPSVWSAAGIAVLGLGLVGWCLITGEMDRRAGERPWWTRLAMLQIYLVIWWGIMAFQLPPITWLTLTPAIVAGSVIGFAGSHSLMEIWLGRLTPFQRTLGLWLMLAAVMTSTALLFVSGAQGTLAGLACGLVALTVIAHRPIAETLVPGALRVRHWAAWLSLIGLGNLLNAHTPFDFLLAGIWILIGPAIVAVSALFGAVDD